MRVVAIIQQRTGSTRLPRKSHLPLAGKTLTQNVIERVQRAKKLDAVCLAVPKGDGDEFKSIANDCNVALYESPQGSDDNDLVERYIRAAAWMDAEIIVRIACDNPCIEPQCIDDAIKVYLDHPHIFVSNAEMSYVNGKWIDGLGCEVMSLSRWKWLDRITEGKPDYREHPHKYFWGHDLVPFMPMDKAADIRLDGNTQEDYENIKDIYSYFGGNHFHITEVLDYLQTKANLAALR